MRIGKKKMGFLGSWTTSTRTKRNLSAGWWTPSWTTLRSLVHHFYYSRPHFHISYLHFWTDRKSANLWVIRPLCGPCTRSGRVIPRNAYRTSRTRTLLLLQGRLQLILLSWIPFPFSPVFNFSTINFKRVYIWMHESIYTNVLIPASTVISKHFISVE